MTYHSLCDIVVRLSAGICSVFCFCVNYQSWGQYWRGFAGAGALLFFWGSASGAMGAGGRRHPLPVGAGGHRGRSSPRVAGITGDAQPVAHHHHGGERRKSVIGYCPPLHYNPLARIFNKLRGLQFRNSPFLGDPIPLVVCGIREVFKGRGSGFLPSGLCGLFGVFLLFPGLRPSRCFVLVPATGFLA